MRRPFRSIDELRQAFHSGLQGLLADGGLGAFILTAANACLDPDLLPGLRGALQHEYRHLHSDYVNAFREGRNPPVVEEDLLVFLKIMSIGLDALQPVVIQPRDGWLFQFNHLRSFRPKRISRTAIQGIQAPYNPQAFHFNHDFMQRECFWNGELLGRQVDLFYNKYPFATLHGLLVVERSLCLPQRLTRTDHEYIWALAEAMDPHLPGVGFGYNAYGAYASVNHLHFQMFVQQQALPVTASCWIHNGGPHPYPACCEAFDNRHAAWQALEILHQREQTYNLLYTAGRLYVFPRLAQGRVEVPEWSSGFTWYELSGGIITFNRNDFETLDSAEFIHELACLRPPGQNKPNS